MTRLEESDTLHRAVQDYAEGRPAPSFEELALSIARFQARYSPGFARLVALQKAKLNALTEIPAVPSQAFRLTRVAVHPESEDAVRFVTSGTTRTVRGVHPMRRLDTYRTLALRQGRTALLHHGRAVVVALAPLPEQPPTSSLAFMMAEFMEHFDGRPLSHEDSFQPRAPDRWLVGQQGVDVAGLERAAAAATERGEPLLLLGTASALLSLLDALGDRRLRVPENTVIMQTGGFKRHRPLPPDQLCSALAETFQIPETRVIGEYGMTELTSQLYEPCASLAPGEGISRERRVYVEPPWLRVTPVHPSTLEAMPLGEVGLARFVDLGNVDSAVAVVTQDLVRQTGRGIELLGRKAGAPERGCSLSVEGFLS